MRDGKHHYIAVSSLILILIVAAILLNLAKPADLEARVNQNVETQEEIVAEQPTPDFETVGENPLKQETPKVVETESCNSISFEVDCNTEQNGFECEYINDGNLTSEWYAGYSCGDDRIPCVVNNNVDITTEKPFQYMKVHNRLSPDFYINRALIDYNDYKKVTFLGGQEFSQTPWMIELLEPTQELKFNIVEIMGVGYRYQSGIAEIELFDCLE